jgi:homoserine dehydrogenase
VKQVRVGLVGLGTVGCGALNILQKSAELMTQRSGCEIKVVMASARDLTRSRPCDTTQLELTTDPMAVATSPNVDVVLELMGGTDTAKSVVEAALQSGKHVVTANKALIARHGNALFALAAQQGVQLTFEAAVAGGIPIIKALREGLAANKIEWLAGIINGTTNFILTEMREKKRTFEDVLKEAQALGYAEVDPTFDVEGIDAAHKLVILASLAFGMPFNFEACYTEGVTKITQADIQYADALGFRIKHLGFAKQGAQGIEMRVHPVLVPKTHLLGQVDGVMNAVLVKGDQVGQTLYYGPGAGAGPTASAVIADLLDVVRLMAAPSAAVAPMAVQDSAVKTRAAARIDQIKSAYYLRISAEDKPGVLRGITQALADESISVEAMNQKAPANEGQTVDLVILTNKVVEASMNAALEKISQSAGVLGEVMRIRVDSLN